jgi:chromosome partitioning protein
VATVAVYSLKGGVGKTSLAVNLAFAAATRSARRTLLWDLDPQAAATFILGGEPRQAAHRVFSKELAPERLIRPTAVPGLDLLPADASLRGLDRYFHDLAKKRRMARLIEAVAGLYDRIVLDCPPGLTETSEQVMHAATLMLVPVIPSPLSFRALDEIVQHLDRGRTRGAPILPVYSMVDRRRALHVAALAAQPDWPVIPMASAAEAMAERRAPLGTFAPGNPAAQAVDRLWIGIERRLASRAG